MPSRATWLFNPRYNYRLPGDKIVYKDEIQIYNDKYNVYLHFTTNLWIDDAEKTTEQVFDENTKEYWIRSLFRRRKPEGIFDYVEANCSINSEKWEIRKYRSSY